MAYSQIKIENRTSITLFKIYNEWDDGSCNPFTSKESASLISKKNADCDDLVLEFLNFKENLKKQKSEQSCCQKRARGCPIIENMLIFEYNKFVDTLYFNNNKYEKKIFDYTNKKEYNDNHNQLLNILFKSKELKDFFEIDFNQLYKETFEHKTIDSVSINDFKIKGENIFGLPRKEVDGLVDGFDTVQTTSERYDDWKVSYDCWISVKNSSLVFHFKDNHPISNLDIDISNSGNEEKEISVFGISIGDSEKKLIEKFPYSTKNIENQKKYFKYDDTYSVEVKFMDKKGDVEFILKDEKIIKIKISFKYPEN